MVFTGTLGENGGDFHEASLDKIAAAKALSAAAVVWPVRKPAPDDRLAGAELANRGGDWESDAWRIGP